MQDFTFIVWKRVYFIFDHVNESDIFWRIGDNDNNLVGHIVSFRKSDGIHFCCYVKGCPGYQGTCQHESSLRKYLILRGTKVFNRFSLLEID